jgi:mannose-6-phosphate isomerase-like protein (cupin superfamily)
VTRQALRHGLRLFIALVGASAAAFSQQPAEKTFASAADVAAMIAKARNERKPDQESFGQVLLQAAPYTVNLASIVPSANAGANVHEKEAEFYYVVEGSATLLTGGKLRNEKRLNPENLTGTGIDGAASRHIAKGDFFLVPENTPHGFADIAGTLVIMSMHVPRGAAAR